MGSIQILLQQQFSQLHFAQDADEWLDTIEGKGVMAQLQERGIRVKIVPMIRPSGLLIDEGYPFTVWLNDIYSPEEMAELLGYEIARTFFFFDPLRVEQDLTKDIERFCNIFSQHWLTKNGKAEIAKRCENQAKLITQCYLF